MHFNTIFDLADAQVAAGTCAWVGQLATMYKAEAPGAVCDGVYTVQGLGVVWRRLGDPMLTLGEAALAYNMDKVTAWETTRASGPAGTTLACSFPKNFRRGMHVCVYGAGGAGEQQAPGAPVVTVPPGDPAVPTTYSYCAVAIGEDHDYSVAGPVVSVVGSNVLSKTAPIVVDFPPSAVPTNAWQLIVYRRVNGGPWLAVHGHQANAHRFRDSVLASEPVRVRFWDEGKAKINLPGWLPATPPTVAGHKVLRTRVRDANATQLVLEHPTQRAVTNAYVAHMAPVQKSLDAGNVRIPEGEAPVRERVRVDKRRRVQGVTRRTSVLRFADSYGLVVECAATSRTGGRGSDTVFDAVGFQYIGLNHLPAGNNVILESDPPAELPGVQNRSWSGCLVLLEDICILEHVAVWDVVGSGVVAWGWPVRPDGSGESNCNNTYMGNLSVSGCVRGHGWMARGSDSNHHMLIKPNMVGNEGWGILDRSFLGSQFLGGHTADNKGGSYSSETLNCFATYVGCYSEQGQGVSVGGPACYVFGGDHGTPWRQSPGTRLIRSGGAAVDEWSVAHIDGSRTDIGRTIAPGELHRYASQGSDPELPLNHRTLRRFGDEVSRVYANTAYEAEVLLGTHEREPGRVWHPRGRLSGPRGNPAVLELTYFGTLPNGWYRRGDRLYDALALRPGGGQGVERTPTEDFGLGPVWLANTVYYEGRTVAPGNGWAYRAKTVTSGHGEYGQSGAFQPNWPPARGASVQDGTVLWECVGPDSVRLT